MTDTKIYWNSLLSQTEVFTNILINALDELGIRDTCKDFEIDHICVRLKDTDDVENLKQDLELVGEIISAVNVNGREIMIIQLNQPISLGDWQTYGIELPNPKPNHNYQDGWEHVEFVFSNVENTMNGVREAFAEVPTFRSRTA